MEVQAFCNVLDCDFYAGVPDSQLKSLCNYLMNRYGIDSKHHVIAANEGNCVALAAGYHLATGKYPAVYLQNSGEGNIINPVASLLNEKVYAIPMIFVIGWRGEPGVHDEPQHIYQGEVTLKLLEDMGIPFHVVGAETKEAELEEAMRNFRTCLQQGKAVAFVIRKGALSYEEQVQYDNPYSLCREDVICRIAEAAGDDPVVSTTGKASRELFEAREHRGQDHSRDFLTVGSMGHSSSIALGIAFQKPDRKIWCIDGDGAVLMHMGAMAVIGVHKPENLIHIVINNEAHETVGGMPTVAGKISLIEIARACGYQHVAAVETPEELEDALKEAKSEAGLRLIEVKCSIASRKDLGRPTTSALDNKLMFMRHLMK